MCCDCGSQRQTAEHFLLHRGIYLKHRDDMIYQLQLICTTKHYKSIPISYNLLLSSQEDQLSKHQNAVIKDILFQFLSNSTNVHYNISAWALISLRRWMKSTTAGRWEDSHLLTYCLRCCDCDIVCVVLAVNGKVMAKFSYIMRFYHRQVFCIANDAVCWCLQANSKLTWLRIRVVITGRTSTESVRYVGMINHVPRRH